MAQAPSPEISIQRPFSRSEIQRRISFAIECAGVLYLACGIVALTALWRAQLPGEGVRRFLMPLLGSLAGPAVAALIFVIVATIVPNLLKPGRIAIPLNVTLPLVYCSFILLTLVLGPGSEPNILRLREVLDWALIWGKPGILTTLLGFQVALFSVLALRGRRAAVQPVE